MIAPGQRWLHVPSGDVRVVHDVVPYEVASGGFAPSDYHRASGVTHVARLVREDGRRDRRDSSDMELVCRHGVLSPFHAGSWRLLEGEP